MNVLLWLAESLLLGRWKEMKKVKERVMEKRRELDREQRGAWRR
jgi:hypothetical protein